jgi:hypothetical protein
VESAEEIIAKCCEKVVRAGRGTRNDTLNRAAFEIARRVGSTEIDHDQTVSDLLSAATKCGLTQDDGRSAILRTIEGGLSAGASASKRHEPSSPIRLDQSFRTYTEAELSLIPDFDYLVDGLIPSGGMISIFGASASGKTFLALDIARAIETGVEWRGRAVKQGLVVYVAAEGASGFPARLSAYKKTRPDLAYGAFRLIRNCPNLGEVPGDMRALVSSIKSAADEHGSPPAAIFVDTLSQTLAGANENGDGMTSMIFNCQTLLKEFPGVSVFVIHHVGHEGTRPRGHSSFLAALDAALYVKCLPDGSTRVVEIAKQKDGEAEPPFRFTLEQVVFDEDGSRRRNTSCVVRYLSNAKEGRETVKTRAKSNLAADSKLIRTVACQLQMNATGQANGHDIGPDGTIWVSRDALKAACYARGFRSDLKQDSRKKAFFRGYARLCDAGVIRAHDLRFTIEAEK